MSMFLHSWVGVFFCICLFMVHPTFVTAGGSKVLRKQGRIWGVSGTDLYQIFHATSVSLLAFQGRVMIAVITHWWQPGLTEAQPSLSGAWSLWEREWSPARKISASSLNKRCWEREAQLLALRGKLPCWGAEEGSVGKWRAVSSTSNCSGSDPRTGQSSAPLSWGFVTVALHSTQHGTLLCYCRQTGVKSFQNLGVGKSHSHFQRRDPSRQAASSSILQHEAAWCAWSAGVEAGSEAGQGWWCQADSGWPEPPRGGQAQNLSSSNLSWCLLPVPLPFPKCSAVLLQFRTLLCYLCASFVQVICDWS